MFSRVSVTVSLYVSLCGCLTACLSSSCIDVLWHCVTEARSCVSPFVCVSTCLCLCMCLYVFLYVCLFVCVLSPCLSACLPICLYTCVFNYLCVIIGVCLSVCMSLCQCVCMCPSASVSVCLSFTLSCSFPRDRFKCGDRVFPLAIFWFQTPLNQCGNWEHSGATSSVFWASVADTRWQFHRLWHAVLCLLMFDRNNNPSVSQAVCRHVGPTYICM